MARSIVVAKIANCRTVLQRVIRDHSDKVENNDIRSAADRLSSILMHLQTDMPLDRVRGFEGEAASVYFGVFDHLIVAQKPDFRFQGRNRRPPLDPVNCLLSFVYTLLMHDVNGALEAAVGFLGLDHRIGHARVFFPDRQELAVAQTACRSSKNTLARPSCSGKLAETMIKAVSFIEIDQGAGDSLLISWGNSVHFLPTEWSYHSLIWGRLKPKASREQKQVLW